MLPYLVGIAFGLYFVLSLAVFFMGKSRGVPESLLRKDLSCQFFFLSIAGFVVASQDMPVDPLWWLVFLSLQLVVLLPDKK